MNALITILFGAIVIAALSILFTFVYFYSIWIQAMMRRCPVSIWKLIGMKLRNVSPGFIMDAYTRAHNAGLGITIQQLEDHYNSGGTVMFVVDAMINARAKGIPVSFDLIAKTDLEGFDLREIDPECFREIANNTANHGLESTGAPPAAGTPETHP